MRLDAPIVLGGLDGTGKTQLRLALEAHPDVAMARGLDLWTELRHRHRRATSRDNRRRIGASFARAHAGRINLDAGRFAEAMAEPSFAAAAREVGRQLCRAAGATRWGVQEALVELQLQPLLADCPDARVVQLVRDPRDRYVARRRAGTLGRHGLTGDLAAWLASVEVGLAQSAARPARYIVVRYEDLVTEPEAALREVCVSADLAYDVRMLTDGPFAVSRRSPLLAGIGSYKVSLSRDELGLVARRLGAALEALGYETMTTESPSTGRRLRDNLGWHAERLAWRVRTSRPYVGSDGRNAG